MRTRSGRLAAAAALLLFTLCALRAAQASNVLPSGAIVFAPPNRTAGDIHFGFSVAFVTIENRNWMMVSAPRATSRYEEKIFTRTGAVFRCSPIEGDCKEVHLIQGQTDSGLLHHLQVDNGTLGGSMDAILGNDGMVICNPAYKELEEPFLDMPGMCYWLHDMTTNDNRRAPRRRFKGNTGDVYIINGEKWRDTHGTPELGFSIHQLSTRGQHLLIGGPGLFAGRGTVALFQHDYLRNQAMENYGVSLSLSNDSYFGYSVTAGRFQASGLLYAGSAPRAEELKGKVIIFDYKNGTKDKDVTTINIKKELKGDQTGEYFGASLIAADINNDGIDELLVGSPLYSSGLGDEGKVYLYMTNRKNKSEILNIKEVILPKNKIPGSRFGTAIAALGDIDKDGFGDIAIGAPYENSGKGSIYIFYGSSESPYLKFEKRIQATDIQIPTSNSLQGFGFSFSRGGDVDNNTYNDLGVGAYLSDYAVILRASPVLRFNSSVMVYFENNKIPMYGDRANLTVCVRPNELLENTGVEIILNIDPTFNRGFINNKRKIGYNITMTASEVKDYCQPFLMTLKNNTKIYKPLEIELSYKILFPKPKNGQFCKHCPILDFKSPKSYNYIHYHTDCAGQVCKTNLSLKGNFTGVRSPFVIGSSNKSSIEMVLEVANSLEASYETYISITFPSEIKLRQIHQTCDKANINSTYLTSLRCEVPYMLNSTTKPFSLSLHFDMNSIPWDINQLQVNISVKGSGEEQNVADDRMTLFLELQHVANVSIKGRSSAENIQYAIKHNDSEDYVYYDRTFTHTYTIINNGPSPIPELNLKFLIPHKVKDAGEEITFLTVKSNSPLSVSLDSSAVKSYPENDAVSEKSRDYQYLNLDCSLPEVECLAVYYNTSETIYANNGLSISFEITGLLKELGPILKQSGIIVRTRGKIENEYIWNQDLDGNTIFSSVAETVLSGKIVSQESVQDWIIIVAVICGILILAILCAVLWRCGFFKRNKPPTSEEGEIEKPETDTADKVDTDPLYEEHP